MAPVNTQQIRNIIFDLGGVILNIDYHKTEESFINLGITDFNKLYSQFHANSFFEDFEKGTIDPSSFVAELTTYAPGLSAQDIISAWNAMLLDFPPGRIDFLLRMKTRYRTFLLSNTNEIHHEAFQKIPLDNSETLDGCFEKVYYSHALGMRKPDKEIFEFVLKDNNLAAAETLFIDDTPANIEAAISVGIRTIYVKPPEKIENLLSDFL
jgi:FMN phosphatase YigB (HAD superfamily)